MCIIKHPENGHDTLCNFNARVGQDVELWSGTIGKESVRKVNSHRILPLTKCAEHDLVITNTLFCQCDKLKTASIFKAVAPHRLHTAGTSMLPGQCQEAKRPLLHRSLSQMGAGSCKTTTKMVPARSPNEWCT